MVFDGVNHWDPRAGAAIAKIVKKTKRKTQRVDFFSGLDTKVTYLTIRDVAGSAEVTEKVVRYALAKGHLQAVRRQPGRAGVLLHPDEAHRWIEERKRKGKKR